MNSNDTVNNQRQNNLIYNDFNNKILEDDYQDMIKYEYELAFAMIVDPDCTYDIERCYVEIPDRLNFREALIHLKENNNWNMPQDSEVMSYEN